MGAMFLWTVTETVMLIARIVVAWSSVDANQVMSMRVCLQARDMKFLTFSKDVMVSGSVLAIPEKSVQLKD